MTQEQQGLRDTIAPQEKNGLRSVELWHLVSPNILAMSCGPGSTLRAADVFGGPEQVHVWCHCSACRVGVSDQ